MFEHIPKPRKTRRQLARGGIEVPPDTLQRFTEEERRRLNIHSGDEVWDEVPEGTLVTPRTDHSPPIKNTKAMHQKGAFDEGE